MSLRLPPPVNVEPNSDQETNSESEDADEDDDQNWDDWVSDSIIQQKCRSLFEDKMFPSIEEAIAYDKSAHGFDINHTVGRLCESILYISSTPDSISRNSA